MVILIVLCLGVDFCAVSTSCMFSCFAYVWVTEWPSIGKIAAHLAYYLFS